jgi:hypothetical protein
MFDPFVLDKHATIFNGAGLGSGLAVRRKLVEAHRVRPRSARGIDLGGYYRVTLL